MPFPALLWGAGALLALIGTAAIVANWDKIVDWLTEFVTKLGAVWDKVRDYIPHTARVYGDKIVEGLELLVRIIHKLYYKENNKWIEESTIRTVPENEVPGYIDSKLSRDGEADITSSMERELRMDIRS